MPTDKSRTLSIRIDTPAAEPYGFVIARETVRTYENGDTNRLAWREVRRALPAIAGDPLPGGPFTIATYADLQAVIAACADALDTEDVAARAAAVAVRAADEAKILAAQESTP